MGLDAFLSLGNYFNSINDDIFVSGNKYIFKDGTFMVNSGNSTELIGKIPIQIYPLFESWARKAVKGLI